MIRPATCKDLFSESCKTVLMITGKIGLRMARICALITPFLCIDAQIHKSALAKPAAGDWGIETRFISKSVSPGNDFYTYVNDGWLKSVMIPAGASGFNSYTEAKDKIDKRLSDLIREGSKTEGYTENPYNDSYRTCSD